MVIDYYNYKDYLLYRYNRIFKLTNVKLSSINEKIELLCRMNNQHFTFQSGFYHHSIIYLVCLENEKK
jgi:hypothetical protein